MSEIWRMGAAELATRIRAREISSREVVEAHPLGLGNDGAGSLRWPAQCCGIAALKPSFARVPIVSPARALTQPIPFAFQLLAANGPMARHVRDLRLAIAAMCSRSVGDPWHIAAPVEGPPLPRPIRVAVTEDPGGLGVHPDVAAAVRRAASALEDAGYVVERRDPPALVRANEIYTQVMTRFGRTTEELPSTAGLMPPRRSRRGWARSRRSIRASCGMMCAASGATGAARPLGPGRCGASRASLRRHPDRVGHRAGGQIIGMTSRLFRR